MTNSINSKSTSRKMVYSGLLAVTLLAAITPAFSQSNGKPATIDATAMGTSTQLGANSFQRHSWARTLSSVTAGNQRERRASV